MKPANSPVFSYMRLIALMACLACLPAHADDYSEVSQLVRVGKLAEALSRADQFLATQAKDPQMRFIKGVIQRDSGKTAEAIATFTKLTEEYPELPEPYNNLAVLYAGQSQFDKARSALEMAIRTNPSYATAHENLGDIYAKLASQAYNKALQLDNANPAVPPKLALIREIFSAQPVKVQHTASATAPTPVPTPAPKLAAVAPVPAVAVAVSPAVQPATPVVANAPPAAPSTATNKPLSVAAVGTETAVQVLAVEAAVAQWAKAWSARDVKSYLGAYGKDFAPPGSISRKTWEEERQQRITSKSSISVKVDNLAVQVSGNHAAAKFLQDYKAGGLAVTSRKTLGFAKVGEQWQIVKESVGN
jgi:tetratricopeptide (TPR) repeat protein